MKENEREIFIGKRGSGKTTYAMKKALEKIEEGFNVLYVAPRPAILRRHIIPTFFETAKNAGYDVAMISDSAVIRKNGTKIGEIFFDDLETGVFNRKNVPLARMTDRPIYRIFDEYGLDLWQFDLITMTGIPAKKVLDNPLNRKLYPNRAAIGGYLI